MARIEESGLDELMKEFAEIADAVPYACENCGTEFDLSIKSGSAKCPSCGTIVKIER